MAVITFNIPTADLLLLEQALCIPKGLPVTPDNAKLVTANFWQSIIAQYQFNQAATAAAAALQQTITVT